jgi:glycosyltransferase involved in cell wall biosynthesis
MVTPAVFFHPDGYSTANTRVMGRRVAGRDFLRAHFEAAAMQGVERLTCHGANRDLAVMFAKAGREHGYQGKVRLVGLEDVGPLADDGILYVPDPSLGRHANFRERSGRERSGRANYSISGVIHTLASGETLDMIAGLTTDPVAEWDALVCTSRAGRAVVVDVIEQRERWLSERVGATRFVRPELPVIPLGVHVEDYAGLRHDKAAARAALGIPEGAHVVVFVGRLSLHAKAHPLPLYLALDKAAETVGPIVLLECGSFGSGDGASAKAFAEMRAHFPRLLGGVVGGATAASEDQKLACMAAADVFTSLADNVQETFGLSVIEAMAAGLPVVVSDWDGYKDTVHDGVDGFRVPTALPAVGAADALVVAYERTLLDYDRYVGYLSQHCVVDIGRAAECFVALLNNPTLASTMGASGEERAKDFAWSRVYGLYQELWAELTRRRLAAAATATPAPRPSGPTSNRGHAETLYRSFPSRFTTVETGFRKVPLADRSVLGLAGVRAAIEGVIDGESASRMLAALESGPKSATQLARTDSEALVKSGQLHALSKYGLVEPTNDAPPEG